MSYEIARSISRKGSNIVITSASNNVFPRKYYHSTFPFNESTLKELAKNIVDGVIQPIQSANNYRWCGIAEVLENTPEEQWANVILERFYPLAEAKCKYIVGVLPMGATNGIEKYVTKRGKSFMATLNQEDATPMPYYLAKWFCEKNKHYTPRMIKVG